MVVCAVITRLDLVKKPHQRPYAPSRFSGVRAVAAPRPRPLSLARDFIDASMCRASTIHSRGLGPPDPCAPSTLPLVSDEPPHRPTDRRTLLPPPSTLPVHSTHAPRVKLAVVRSAATGPDKVSSVLYD